ncbi:MAG: hypothetical protein V4718_00745 [Pseudomonadota bacterium]
MTTAFGQIAGALKTLFEAAPAVSNQVYRARIKSIEANHNDAVVIRLQGGVPERFAILNAPMDWETEIAIECYARSRALTADEAVDALLAKVWAKLTADTSLGGLVMDLNITNLDYDFAGEAEHMACVTVTLRVLHRTQNHSLE